MSLGATSSSLAAKSSAFFTTARAVATDALPFAILERIVEIAGGIAAVIGRAGRRLIGIGVLGDQIATAQLDAIDAHFARRLVDQPFEQIGNVRPPSATVRGDRRGVGEREAMPAIE